MFEWLAFRKSKRLRVTPTADAAKRENCKMRRALHCGSPDMPQENELAERIQPRRNPRSGVQTAHGNNPCPDEVLDNIRHYWTILGQERLPHPGYLTAREVAERFVVALSRQRIIGCTIRSAWVRESYGTFCRSFGLSDPPPYKDFARELGLLIPRKRSERWTNGKRESHTIYFV